MRHDEKKRQVEIEQITKQLFHGWNVDEQFDVSIVVMFY